MINESANVSIAEKLQLIKEAETGVTATNKCEEYRVKNKQVMPKHSLVFKYETNFGLENILRQFQQNLR